MKLRNFLISQTMIMISVSALKKEKEIRINACIQVDAKKDEKQNVIMNKHNIANHHLL